MIKIVSSDLPNIPWEDKPHNCEGPIWRYSKNPIVKRRPIANVSRVFNSALIPYQGSYIGVFRGETLTGVPYLYLGRSQDGIKIIFEAQPLKVVDVLGKEVYFEYAYDPRLIEIENVFYISSAKSINTLRIIAHHTKILETCRQLLDNEILCIISILVLVHHNIAKAILVF